MRNYHNRIYLTQGERIGLAFTHRDPHGRPTKLVSTPVEAQAVSLCTAPTTKSSDSPPNECEGTSDTVVAN